MLYIQNLQRTQFTVGHAHRLFPHRRDADVLVRAHVLGNLAKLRLTINDALPNSTKRTCMTEAMASAQVSSLPMTEAVKVPTISATVESTVVMGPGCGAEDAVWDAGNRPKSTG